MYSYNRDSRIMRKLLGKGSTENTPVSDLPGTGGTSSSAAIAYRPLRSQNTSYSAGSPISCFDVSPDQRAAILAGPHILKTVNLGDAPAGSNERPPYGNLAPVKITEGVDLRAVITSQAAIGVGAGHGPGVASVTPSRSGAVVDQLNIRDVKWHGSSTIFTACANGSIFGYDIARLGSGSSPNPAPGPASEPLHYIQIRQDSRQVNTLDVNPHLRSWLLSGSQDGVARVFDVSTPWQNRSGVLTFRQRFAPLKCIDSVTQVRWSPKVGHEMAACTEAGVVLKWDVRQQSRPLLRINAHEKGCSAIAWHPDGTHLISAGWDTKLHVWDLGNTADKRQKPKWTIVTPAPVATVAWRPGLWSATAQGRRVAQVAVSYDESTRKRFGSSVVQIWDLARPTMPYKEIERFDSGPTALSWHCPDILWTVGPDGVFNQCDVAFASKVADRQSSSASAFSSKGDVVVFLDERPEPPRPRVPAAHLESDGVPRNRRESASKTPMLSISRSDSEEDIGSFLGPRRKINRSHRSSTRSSQQMSTTPPSASTLQEDGTHLLALDQALRITGIFKTQQAMAFGHVPAATSAAVYQYLTNAYLAAIQRDLPSTEGGRSLIQRIAVILEDFARAAEGANLFRLAQTWRVLSFAMNILLKRRAQYHLESRIAQFQKFKVEERKSSDRSRGLYPSSGSRHAETSPQPTGSKRTSSADSRSLQIRSLLSEEIESTSNVTTPIARPVDAEGVDVQDHAYHLGKKLSPIVEPESFTLDPVMRPLNTTSPRKRLDSEPISERSHRSESSQMSSVEGYDFYGTANLITAIDVPAGKESHEWKNRPSDSESRSTVSRYDSNESFGQMFSVSDGRQSMPQSTNSRPVPPQQTSNADCKSESTGGEYESRIRGAQLADSTGQQKWSGQPKSQSSDEVFMISQTTNGTDDAFPSQTSYGSSSLSDRPSEQTAGSMSVPEVQMPISETPRPLHRDTAAPAIDPSPHIIEADYFPWPNDPPYPHPLLSSGSKSSKPPISPLDPHTLLMRALSFESRTSALNASALVLLLKPLVPSDVIDFFQASAILRQQHSRLMGMGLFVEAALLRNMCIRGWPEGLPEWGDNYTAIFSQAQVQGVKVGLLCPSCRKPREVDPSAGPNAVWKCERCRHVMGPCAVCKHRDLEPAASPPVELATAIADKPPPADDDDENAAPLTEWWLCPGCSHGGHASCLQQWHAPVPTIHDPSAKLSDGCCPLDGCGHACLPGRYRGETAAARAEELGLAAAAAESAASRSRDDTRRASMGGTSSAAGSRRSSPRPSPAVGSAASGDWGSVGGVGSSAGNGGGGVGIGGGGIGLAGVRSDGNDVPQSRAVNMAREALNKGSAGSGGILSSSPGRSGYGGGGGFGSGVGSGQHGDRERKSVKFASTGRS